MLTLNPESSWSYFSGRLSSPGPGWVSIHPKNSDVEAENQKESMFYSRGPVRGNETSHFPSRNSSPWNPPQISISRFVGTFGILWIQIHSIMDLRFPHQDRVTGYLIVLQSRDIHNENLRIRCKPATIAHHRVSTPTVPRCRQLWIRIVSIKKVSVIGQTDI